MHADKLYHQMMEQQEAIKRAEEQGEPVPSFKPVLPTTADAEALMSESAKKRTEEALAKMQGHEREAERAALEAEMRAKKEMVDQIQDLWKVQETERKVRMEKGEGTTWDRMATAWKTVGSAFSGSSSSGSNSPGSSSSGSSSSNK